MKIKSIMIFGNGNVAVFDDNGEQVPELQKGWMRLFLNFLEEKGADISKAEIVDQNGRAIFPFKTDEGEWNWSYDKLVNP